MDLLSAEIRAAGAQAMTDLFDSFKRTQNVVFYKSPKETMAVFNNPNYNADFQEKSETSDVVRTVESASFEARVWYLVRQDFGNFLEGGNELGIKAKQLYNRIRIQVEEDGFNYLKDTVRFIFFDEEYQIDEGWQRLGIFSEFQFYQIILKRVN